MRQRIMKIKDANEPGLEHGLGYVESKKDLRDYRLNRKICKSIALPETFEVKHSKIKKELLEISIYDCQNKKLE